MDKVVGFGEIMLRLSPPGKTRFTQSVSFDVIYERAESNVLTAFAHWGIPSELVTLLPEHELGEACLQTIRRYNMNTSYILRGGERIGIYFYENGSSIRGSKVIYDRANSYFTTIQPGLINWEDIFENSSWFHWTGITQAVSEEANRTLLES